MSQTLAYAIELSGALKAARDAEEFNKKLNGTENAAISVDKSLARLEHQMKQLNEAIKSGKGNTAAYAVELERLQSEYSRLSGSVQNFGDAVKTVSPKMANLGQAALESSRALEDLQYGIGGVVNNIPSLVMALGGGAGLTAAISLGAVAVNQFVKSWTAVDPAVKEATDAAKERVTKLKEEVISMRRELAVLRSSEGKVALAETQETFAEVEKRAKAATDKLGVILGNYDGIKAYELIQKSGAGTDEAKQIFKDAEAVMKEYFMAKEAVALKNKKLQIEQIELDGKAADAHSQKINDQIELENELAKEREKNLKKIQKEEEKERKRQEKQQQEDDKRQIEKLDRERERLEKAIERRNKQLVEEDRAFVEQQKRKEEKIQENKQRRMDQISNFADDSLSSLLAKNDVFTDSVIGKLGILEDAEFNSLNRRMDQQKRYYENIGKMTEQYASDAIDIGQQYIDMIVKDEEDKERKLAVIVMRQTGQALVSNGIRSLGHAAEFVASGPAGWGQAAISGSIGLGLIGAGMTLGGVASGVEGQIQATASAKKEAEKEQKKLDRERERESKRERGVSPSRSSGGASGGITLNLTYGVAGPLPEDTARLIKRELQTASRRNGA